VADRGEDLERDGQERDERGAERPAGEDQSAVGAVLPGEHPVEVAVVPVEAGVDGVGAALHRGSAFHACRLVPSDRVDGGLEAADVLPHLEQELALRDARRSGLVAAHGAVTARTYPVGGGAGSRCGSDQRAVMPRIVTTAGCRS
jgi:hypothetical protein